jgi:cyclopropane-fatty-acyl-phospholipid synthase
MPPTRKPIAPTLGRLLGGPPIEVTAYDGSRYGPVGAPVRVVLRSPKALSYLITAPGKLGMARAYVAGELDIDGDVYQALSLLWSDHIGRLSWADRLGLLRGMHLLDLRCV